MHPPNPSEARERFPVRASIHFLLATRIRKLRTYLAFATSQLKSIMNSKRIFFCKIE